MERNLKDYQGLDNLISINPENFTQEQRNRFIKLCDICPNLQVINDLYENVEYYSTGREYKEAEEWISSVIDNIPSEYSQAQKIAIIDNAIGKKISHTPTDGTEVFEPKDSKALWKIISKGYGVCNGVAKVEQYMLKRIGVESEIVSGHEHAFLKLIDVSKLKIQNEEELHIVIQMLYLITRKALVNNFKYQSTKKARKEYLKMIDYLKKGVLK